MFQKPVNKWKKVLKRPIEKQTKFLNKICKVNRRDALVLKEKYFEDLSFDMVREIFSLVNKTIANGGFDPSFRDLILDRLLRVINIESLYPEEYEDDNVCNGDDDNVIFGENYHVYTACYDDLNLIVDFINSKTEIKTVCDLGSGSGRALLYMALKMDRKVDYLGLELVDERVKFTNSIVDHFSLNNLKFKTCDFLETPQAFQGFDAYYLYDSVGTQNVPRLISHFKDLMKLDKRFYLVFISGWDDIMLNALGQIDELEELACFDSHKQEGRFVKFYQFNPQA